MLCYQFANFPIRQFAQLPLKDVLIEQLHRKPEKSERQDEGDYHHFKVGAGYLRQALVLGFFLPDIRGELDPRVLFQVGVIPVLPAGTVLGKPKAPHQAKNVRIPFLVCVLIPLEKTITAVRHIGLL